MIVLYPPYWFLINALTFTAIVWITVPVRRKRRLIARVLSFFILFVPGVMGVHSTGILYPLIPVYVLKDFQLSQSTHMAILISFAFTTAFAAIILKLIRNDK